MATRSRTSFNKRQKELARMEKQRDKAARRAQRKLEKLNPTAPDPDALEQDPDALEHEPEAEPGDGPEPHGPAGETA